MSVRSSIRKFLAIALTFLLTAAAIFLPARLSQWNDRLLLDEPHILQEEREGFGESVGLTVAEKVILLRTGGLDSLTVGDAEMRATYTGPGGENVDVILQQEKGGLDADEQRKLTERITAVQAEVRSLQVMGGLPLIWDTESSVECVDRSQILYVDRETQISFLVYRMTLNCPPYSLELSVDAQSGQVLAFSLFWGRDGSLTWGPRGSSAFGGAWRDYWGMDSVSAGWYNEHTRSILEDVELRMQINGEYNAVGEVAYAYSGQSIHIPLLCWAYNSGRYSLHWNP